MKFLALTIRRPIAVAMVYLVIAAVGFNFFTKLPLEEVPRDNLPRVDVTASLTGTNPETMEAFVTSPIEAIVNTVKGIKSVSSSTTEGNSTINAEFVEDTDMKYAELEIKERLEILKEELPPGLATSVRMGTVQSRVLGNQQVEPLRYTLTGNFTLEWIRQYAEEELKNEIQGIDGVGTLNIYGGRKRLIKIEIDKNKADIYGVNETMITRALYFSNLDRNAGYINRDGRRFDIFIKNRMETVQEFYDILVKNDNGRMIFLKDIAMIYDDFQETMSIFRINGNPVVSMNIEQEESANTVTFVEEVEAMVEKLRQDFPITLQMIRENNPGQRVQRDIANIQARAVFCILVIFLVLYVFLRNLKVPILILSTILFSELTTIIFFYAFDISFNILTIAGLALGFGMLVDSAIVVIDNIFRYRESGEKPYESAIKGAKEVFLPLLASVTTTSIVFLPFLYLDKSIRVEFTPVALAVALSLLSSMIVAFTFIPTFALKFLPEKNDEFEKNLKKNTLILRLTHAYERFIELAVRKKYWTLAIVGLLFASSLVVYEYTRTTFTGFGGSGGETQIRVSVRMPVGAEFGRADDIAKKLEDRILTSDYVKILYTQIGPSGSRYSTSVGLNMYVRFTEEAEEVGYPYVLYDEITSYASTFAGVSISVSGVGDYFSAGGSGGTGSNFRIQVKGFNYNMVGQIADQIGRNLERVPRVKNVNSNTNYFSSGQKFETVIKIKRDDLGVHGVSVTDVLGVINRHVRTSSFNSSTTLGGDEVYYTVKVKDFEKLQVEDLNDVMFVNSAGDYIRLREVTEIGTQKIMNQITRKDQQYERTIGFEYRGPHQLGKALVDKIKESSTLPKGYSITDDSPRWGMDTRELVEFWLIILAAVVMVYMMTSSLYESLLHPFVVILTVPMALIGVFYIFFFAGQAFNRAAYIGVILLAGIVVNNSIILVDHINLLRSRGLDLYTAVIQGCKDRVRPILMTSVTTILGLIPLILFVDDSVKSYGGDQGTWYTISLASIGGLLSATPLTLSVIPVLYILIEEWRNKLRKHWNSAD